MIKFLPRDPTAAMVEIKEKLYERLDTVKRAERHEFDLAACNALNDEIDFITDLLDLIERS